MDSFGLGMRDECLFVLPFIDYFCCSLLPYEHWYGVFRSRASWTFLAAFAILGFVLDALKVKGARAVNVGLWCLFAVKITAAFFGVWGGFTEDAWIALILVPFALFVATVDFSLYRPRLSTRT
ncbi:MAG: hypothetical protein WB660_24670 [Candidatus Sulfotelmatobacter sp.]